MPWTRRERLVEELGLSATEARDLVAVRELADYFEAVVAAAPALPRAAANWVRNDLVRELRERQAELETGDRTGASGGDPDPGRERRALVERARASCCGRSGRPARAPLPRCNRLGLAQVRDETQLVSWVGEVLRASPDQAAQFRAGKTQVLGYLVGQVMKRSAGRADPRRIQELVRAALVEETDPAN